MAYFSVTTAAPSGPGSLSDAVAQANLTPGDDDIGFAPALNGATITLGGALEVTQGIVRIFGDIDGDRVGDITISGDTNASGAPDAGDAKFFVTRGEGQVELDSLTLTGGYDGPGGTVGVLANEGRRMVITNSVVKDSVSVADDFSYGSYFSNAATISNFGQELVIFDTLLQGNLSFAGSGVNSDGPNNVAGILTGAGVLSIDGVGFGVEAIGGQGAPGYDGGDGVVGILITGGSIQGDGGDPRLGLATNAGAFPGVAGAGGAPGVAVLGLAEARGGFDYVINTPIFGLSGDIAPNTIDRSGETENQILLGFAGADTLRGGAGDDQIFGGQDDDVLSGGGGVNLVDGGQGFDTGVLPGRFGDFIVGPAGETGVVIDTGDGVTTFMKVEAFAFTDTTLSRAGVLNLATEGDDTLRGFDLGDEIDALGGNDLVTAGLGDDLLRGGDGADTLLGEGGADEIFGDAGADSLVGGGGGDSLAGGGGADELDGGGGKDVLFGAGGRDDLEGMGGRDTLLGGGGKDTLRGGAGGREELNGGGGNDVLFGGRGNRDSLTGGGGRDVFKFKPGDRNDVITDFEQGKDRIEIISGADSFRDLGFSQLGNDVLISFANVRSTVLDQQVGSFAPTDFIGIRGGGGGGPGRNGLAPDRDADFGAQAGGGEDALF